MAGKVKFTWEEVNLRAVELATQIRSELPDFVYIYGVPRGGLIPATMVTGALKRVGINAKQVSCPEHANLIIDDIVDSGETQKRHKSLYQQARFESLYQKTPGCDWIVFPWEAQIEEVGPEDNIRRILQYIGEDPDREGLKETPARVVKSYKEIFGGYQFNTDEAIGGILKVFEDGACDEMVLLKNIQFTSTCEHHMLPFTGVAHIAYLPDKKVVGVSKLARILEVFSRRLQIQERLTTQVTDALDKHLQPHGSACVIVSHHSCMSCRGVKVQGSEMVTSSITKDFRRPEVRQEFFSLIS